MYAALSHTHALIGPCRPSPFARYERKVLYSTFPSNVDFHFRLLPFLPQRDVINCRYFDKSVCY